MSPKNHAEQIASGGTFFIFLTHGTQVEPTPPNPFPGSQRVKWHFRGESYSQGRLFPKPSSCCCSGAGASRMGPGGNFLCLPKNNAGQPAGVHFSFFLHITHNLNQHRPHPFPSSQRIKWHSAASRIAKATFPKAQQLLLLWRPSKSHVPLLQISTNSKKTF